MIGSIEQRVTGSLEHAHSDPYITGLARVLNANLRGGNVALAELRARFVPRTFNVPFYCIPCREELTPEQSTCPFCDNDATPVDELVR